MAASTWAVLCGRARSTTVGIPIGRLSAGSGVGLHPRRTGGGGSPGVCLCRSTSWATPARCSMPAATRCPSTPVARVWSRWWRWARRLSRGMGWAHEVHGSCGALRAVAVLLARAGATGTRLPGAVSSLFPLPVSGPCGPCQGQALRPPAPWTRLSRAPRTLGPSDCLRRVTRAVRGARVSRRSRSSVWAVSAAAGSPTSTQGPLSACCGAAPRQSQPRRTLERACGCCRPCWGTRSASSTTSDGGARVSRAHACSGPQTPWLRFTRRVAPAACKTRFFPAGEA